ncbi:tail fiber assembly protein [Morganella morganii]|uniref:Tail fiber assembly protein n=1 Tax=Morganella morganii TaxID=582 RepID=A0AAU8ZJM6_MORMO|nr:tail fiber assembly protein [Morganella morganii]AWC93112.1 tail fiber assembly protein [Morganella morganii]
MNKYRFNPENNMFYPYSMKESYETSGDWPAAGADVSEDIFLKFIGEAPDGKKLGSDKKGNPVWVDIPPLMHEQHVAIAELRKQALIAEVPTETEMLRAKLALGRISDDEKVLLNAWLDYLDKLKAVDVSTAPDIIWPVKPVV